MKWSHRASSVCTSQTPISKMVQYPHSMRLPRGNPSHLTENCTSLNYRVQELINDGELTFEDLDGPVEVKDLSRAKVEIARQEHGVPREASPRKNAIPRDEVLITKVEKDGASGSLTTEGSKAQLYGSNIEEEEKSLQCMMRKLELMLKEQK